MLEEIPSTVYLNSIIKIIGARVKTFNESKSICL